MVSFSGADVVAVDEYLLARYHDCAICVVMLSSFVLFWFSPSNSVCTECSILYRQACF